VLKPIAAVPVRKLSVYLQPFRRSSFLECALQPKITKINEKNPYFGSLESFKVIDVHTTEKLITIVLVVIGSMPMPICNRFHERLANNSKITTFMGVPLLMPLCAVFLEPRKSRLGPSKSTSNAENFIRILHVYLN